MIGCKVDKRYKRSRIELYVDILRAICDGRVSPSRIVYAANLSYDRVIRCIDFLEEKKLIQRINDEKKEYETTEKGREVIQYFDAVQYNFGDRKKISSYVNVPYVRELPKMR